MKASAAAPEDGATTANAEEGGAGGSGKAAEYSKFESPLNYSPFMPAKP
jgi:hypothetical protein